MSIRTDCRGDGERSGSGARHCVKEREQRETASVTSVANLAHFTVFIFLELLVVWSKIGSQCRSELFGIQSNLVRF